MFVGKVVGNLWATRKDETLNGLKFLIVEKENSNEIVVAGDNAGAGISDLVLVTTGSSARVSLGKEIPVDAVIVAIIDSIERE